MMKKNKTKKIFFSALTFALVAWAFAVLFFFLIEYKNNKNADFSDEIKEQSSRVEEVTTLSRNTKVLREKLINLDEIFVKGDQESIVSLIEDIESISKVSAVTLDLSEVKISSINQEEFGEYFENVDLKIEVDGNWNQVFYFLNLLENLPYNIVFKESKISSVSDNNDLGWKGYFNISVSKAK